MNRDGARTGGSRAGVPSSASAVLVHPLLGSKPRRTAVGVGYVLLSAAVVGISAALRQTLFLGGGPDQLQGFAIVLAVAALGVGLAYAAWNGGPALAAAIPLAPVLVGTLSTGRLVLEVDLVLALAAAAGSAAVGTYATGLRTLDSWRPGPYPGLTDGLAVATPFAVLGAVALWRTAPYVGPHASAGVPIAGLFLGVAVLALGFQWGVWIWAARRQF